ncbi:MAG: Gfo/Idh/MocA family oxidoreductase [Chloroflexi bacterium]|nr:Gfo/Idh/MocA family oxidoreductase [Chloroflexota bacterium]
MPEDIVRYGIISTAQIAMNAHVPAAVNSHNSVITAVSSRGVAKAKQAAESHDIPKWYGSYEELLADPDIDAVVNPLPNSMHAEWTIKAAEAGKHVLCEKPIGVTMAEVREMIAACEANNVALVEAFTHRFDPHLRNARRLIAEGAIGEVTNLESALTFPVVEPEGNVRFSKDLVGGSMWDAGCYAVYASRFVMSAEPVRATAMSHDSGNWGVDTTFSGMLEYPNGAVARVGSSMEQARRCFLTAYGTTGTISIPNMFDDNGPCILTTLDGEETVYQEDAPYRFTAQFNEFSECVLTGKTPEYPPVDALRNTASMVALYEAAGSGRTVEVEQI